MNKEVLKTIAIQLLEQKLVALDTQIAAVQESAGADTKSSAGDKYETSRAMMHLEQEKLHRQRASFETQLAVLQRIDFNQQLERVQLGAVLDTGNMKLCVAVGLGKVDVPSIGMVFFVSADAPITKAIWHKAAEDNFMLSGNFFTVKTVC